MKYKISDIATIISGGTPKKTIAVYWNGNIPWLTIKDFNTKTVTSITSYISDDGLNNSSTNLTKNGDILISARGTVGKLLMVRPGMTFNQSIYCIRPKEQLVNPEYLYYWLYSNIDKIKKGVHGSVFDTITRKTFDLIEINLPDLSTQQELSNKIKILDEKAELNRQINANLFNLANTLFKHYFPDVNTGTNKIGDYIKNFDKLRKPLSKKQRSEIPGKYRYIGATSVNDYIDKYNFDGIFLLLGEDGTVQDEYGFPVLQYTFGKFWPNNHAHVLQGKNVSTEWLYLYFSQRDVSGIVTGAVQKKISQKNMNSLKFKLPDSRILKEFDKIIQPLFSKIRSIELENYHLEELKGVLLSKLF